VKRGSFNKIVILAVFVFFIFSALTFAADKGIVKSQGIVMALDLKKKTMIVNERSYIWDQSTIVHNEKGSPVSLDTLKAKTWVYLEGAEDKVHKKVLVKKIYLLPRYIDEKDKHSYPFIK
jgi:hypothetical protein